MKFTVNLAERPFVNHLPHAIALAALAATAILLTAWNVTALARTSAARTTANARLAAVRAERKAVESEVRRLEGLLADTNVAELQQRTFAANDVYGERAVRWHALLEHLEDLFPWSAQLSSIRTSVKEGRVDMSLEMYSKAPAFTYELLDSLETSPCFSSVWPVSEELMEEGDYRVLLQVTHDPLCGRDIELPEQPRRRKGRNRG